MEKITLKLAEYPEHPEGYGIFDPPSEKEIWQFTYKNLPKEKKYLQHFVKEEWVRTEGFHTGYGANKGSCHVPLGVLTYYIDIYCEDK